MKPNQPRLKRHLLALSALLVAPFALLGGCSSTYPNRNPLGDPFPSVVGESLEGQEMALPGALAGQPAVLLLGYEQETQFDIDRWLMGLIQAEVDATIIEIPTIPALVPTLISGWIDDGMRAGIPSEDWGSVVTLYGGAAKPVAKLTGTENGRQARVIVLDRAGEIAWFTDAGYSVRGALEIAELVTRLGEK